MLDLIRDANRLTLLNQDDLALERFTVTAHLHDFFSYYYQRFLTNITHVFKDFTTSELSDFNKRHRQKLHQFFDTKNLDLSKILIPIPQDMVFSYLETILELEGILHRAEISSLLHDLNQLHQELVSKKIDSHFKTTYSDQQFDDDKDLLAKHYHKKGLTHKLSSQVFTSLNDVKQVNVRLEEITLFYPELLEIYKIFPQIEASFKNHDWSLEEKQYLAAQFLEMAHRLSIVGVTMQQIQKMEHAFVKALTLMMKEI